MAAEIASGLWRVDETLQRELDVVQAVYFPPELEIHSSSDSDGESSDDDRSNVRFENSTVLTPFIRASDRNEGLRENPKPGDTSTEVSDECIRTFLSASCQCSLGPNERPCCSLKPLCLR